MAIGTDEELFNATMSDLPAEEPKPAPEPSPEPDPEVPAEEQGQPRDEHGKFAKKAEAQPEPDPQPSPEAQAQPEPKREDHRIPLAEHLSVRERAQRAEQERDQERQQRELDRQRMAALERQIAELSRPKQPVETPDVWADPGAYVDSRIEPIRQGQEAVLERMSRAFAVDKYGQEAVNAAMSELERQMATNPNARFEHQRIMASDHPYGELVAWHKRQSALREVGDDPAAYKQRVIEEALKDPEVIKRVIEGARTQAQQPAANGQPRSPTVSLPPSLNRATGSGGQVLAQPAQTDAEMFKDMFPQ